MANVKTSSVFVVYRSPHRDDWRWRLLGPGEQIIAVSGSGYPTEQACRDAIRELGTQAATAAVELVGY
jgi:uncharacterized protein YegP (UPF0339 family)